MSGIASLHITFMRHGRSRADDEGVHEGRCDSPLTEIGRAQAQSRAQAFQEHGMTFDVIICSLLRRAQSTAQVMAEILRVPVELDEDWLEMDNGPLAGMKREVAAEKYPPPSFRNPYEPLFVRDFRSYGGKTRFFALESGRYFSARFLGSCI